MQALFEQVAKQFKSQHQYEKFIKEAVKEYDIKTYRLHLFPVQHAIKVYNNLCQDYDNNSVSKLSSGWHQNERRLYVWFIVCYIHYKLLDANKLVDSEKHWKNISHTFWDKEISFLKYQLQNIIKTRGRITWRPDQDELLKQIYPNHQKGEWNEIAKDFYFKSQGRYFKTPKQCRERWQNHLNNHIKRGDWTPEQDLVLFQQVKKHGTKWARIIPLLNNMRTEHMIKNRYKALLNKAQQGKNVKQNEALESIIRKLRDNMNENKSQKKEAVTSKKQVFKNNGPSQQIQFVQSEQLIQEPQEPFQQKPATLPPTKRGETKNIDTIQLQSNRKKELSDKNSFKFQAKNNMQRTIQIQGCKIIGPSFSGLNSLIYPGDSIYSQLSHSNSFFRSSNHGMFNSGNFSMNNSIKFPYEDKSFIALDKITIKEDKIDKMEKKQTENQSFKSFKSIRYKPNESLFFGLMN